MSEVKRYEMKTTYRGHESWDSLEEDQDGGYVSYEDYAELEAKCAALAAENAGLKEFISLECMVFGDSNNLLVAEPFIPQTTATDSFLAEVRAQGGAKALEDFAEFNIKNIDPFDDEYTDVLKETARAARCFAAQLRKGGNHTEQNLDMVDHFGDATQKATLQGSEPETDNTNQQFESLAKS